MAHSVQNKRGPKSGLPELKDAEFGLVTDTKELFIGCGGENLPVLTLKEEAGGPMGIDTVLEEGSNNLVTSGAVQGAIGNIDALLKTI